MSETGNDSYHKIGAAPTSVPRGCPVNPAFTPFDAGYLSNPYPQLRHLQAQSPIFYSEKLGYLVVTGMQNVIEVFKNHAVFSSENVQDPIFPVCEQAQSILSVADYNPQAVMSNRQQPGHTRIRAFTGAAFNARRMKILEPYIAETAEALIAQMQDSGRSADIVSALAHPLPGQVIFRLIGFPEQDDAQLISWTADRLMFTWGQPSAQQQVQIAENLLRYWRYCRAFVAQRIDAPADDLTSELLAAHTADPAALSRREIESIIYGLSFAGHEIVSNFISLALLNFLPDRALWQQLCEGRANIAKALEEVLRFDSPQTSWRRVATADTTLMGVEVPKGTRVLLSLGAANHDPEIFADPTTFAPDRPNANRHVAFGHGIHFCLGARLARLEAQIAMQTLTQRLPSLRLVADQQLLFSPNMTFRGPTALAVEWDT